MIYISGPMSGVPDGNVEEFDRAEKWLIGLGYHTVNPAHLRGDNVTRHADFLRADLKALLDCDQIFMLEGWQRSPGARAEMEVAAICGINIWFQNREQMG